jgi:hypothetical protein
MIIVCLVALVAITAALQEPTKSTKGTCSVNGYVINTYGEGIPDTEVTLHVVGSDGAEIYNMTTPTGSSQPYAGLYVFDSVVITPEVQYAYVSTTILNNDIEYYGFSSNFTLQDNTTINKSIVMHLPSGSATTVSGYVVNSYGTGIPNINVTLHMLGSADDKDLYNVTTVTNSTGSFVGLYMFENVTPVPGAQSGYVSAAARLAENTNTYGRSNNFTFKGGSASLYVVLHVPPEYRNATLISA